MTRLNLDEVINMNLPSMEEVARASWDYGHYKRWLREEKRLIDEGKAENLSQYFLYQYHIENRSSADLGREFKVASNGIRSVFLKLGIPIKTLSEAGIGRKHSQAAKNKLSQSRTGKKYSPLSEEHKRKISQRHKGKRTSEETKRKLSEYWKGKNLGANNPNYGNHLSEEVKIRMSYAKIGIPLSKQHRQNISKGLRRLPESVRRNKGVRSIESYRRNAYNIENRFYASSQQEGAVALILEKYVPGYQVRDGINFQVKDGIANGGIDFLVNCEFLEWHPIVLMAKKKGHGSRGDIQTHEEYESYQKILRNLAVEQRIVFLEDYKTYLSASYRISRQAGVDSSKYSKIKIYAVTNARDLYNFILRNSKTLPEYKEFVREFNRTIKRVKQFKVKEMDGGK